MRSRTFQPVEPRAEAKRSREGLCCATRGDRVGSVVGRHRASAFTLVEVLAALAFMAIVIPVAVEGLRVAQRAGLVGERKAAAARVASRVMAELTLSGQWRGATARGVVVENEMRYAWTMSSENWIWATMRVITVAVTFPIQGQEFEVRLSTLMDGA